MLSQAWWIRPWRVAWLLYLPLRPVQVIRVPGEGGCLGDSPTHWPWLPEPTPPPQVAYSSVGSWESAGCQKGGSQKTFLPGRTSYCILQWPFLLNRSPVPCWLSFLLNRREPDLSASVKLNHLSQGPVSSTATFLGPQNLRNKKAQNKNLALDQGNFKGPAHTAAPRLVTGPLSAFPLSEVSPVAPSGSFLKPKVHLKSQLPPAYREPGQRCTGKEHNTSKRHCHFLKMSCFWKRGQHGAGRGHSL